MKNPNTTKNCETFKKKSGQNVPKPHSYGPDYEVEGKLVCMECFISVHFILNTALSATFVNKMGILVWYEIKALTFIVVFILAGALLFYCMQNVLMLLKEKK